MKSNNGLLLVSVVVGVLVLLYIAYDTYYTTPVASTPVVVPEASAAPVAVPETFTAPEAAPETFTAPVVENFESNSQPAQSATPNGPASHMSGEVLGAQDLLPQCADSPYAQVIPNGQGNINDGNLLNAGYHIGVNTVGSSLRNANRQLRSEPPNPQVKVSPWNQTTIETDINRRELEIGN